MMVNVSSISDVELQRRMIGCWLGKAVGGTLGMPYEGVLTPLDLDFYDPVPTEMLPNDDLDLQVIYAFLLDQCEQPNVNRFLLSECWQYIGMSPDEYGVCKRNMKLGLKPPATGSYDNAFTDGMGAAIRTEIWACLAPGNPALAVAYAYEDACMDHAGEGIYAAQFLAALQSLAFVESDINTLLDEALPFIPKTSTVFCAIENVRQWHEQKVDWREIQKRILKGYPTDNFTDVTINLAFIVLGWLVSEGDFSKGICTAVNCGMDTDCTGATLGALMGIIDPDSIEARWLKPIGRDLVLSPSIAKIKHPPTLDGFTDLMMGLNKRIASKLPQIQDGDQTDEQAVDHLAIHAEIGFTDTPLPACNSNCPSVLPEMMATTFAGTMATLDTDQWKGNTLFVRYQVTLAETQTIQILFNTPAVCRVWLDDDFLLGRDGGTFVPALHRAPKHQISEKIEVSAGKHTLLAAIEKPTDKKDVTWILALVELDSVSPVCNDWMTGVFDRVGRE